MNWINAPMKWLRSLRLLRWLGMIAYCAAIWLALDFAYSYFFHHKDRIGRASNEHYHHGLAANFEGWETWGSARTRVHTNSLGFKDARVRTVSAATTERRIVLIGDSFTEGLGVPFEETFAGLLYFDGQKAPDKIEYLNAAAVSYSPVIYYKKIKYFLDAGLKFDEVIVFSDLSDVQNEASINFCLDDSPEYRRHCATPPNPPSYAPTLDPAMTGRGFDVPKSGFADRFSLTSRIYAYVRQRIDVWTGKRLRDLTVRDRRGGWTKAGLDVGRTYEPLGIEGGIARSLVNMQKLADLLKTNGIDLTIVVYPWPFQLAQNDRDSRQVRIWRDFCAANCKRFIDLFPAFFAEKDARADWLEYLFIPGDVHHSQAGHRIVFREVKRQLATK